MLNSQSSAFQPLQRRFALFCSKKISSAQPTAESFLEPSQCTHEHNADKHEIRL